MIEIIPAILPEDFLELEDKISSVIGLVPIVQVDVLDGRLTASKSWPYRQGEDSNFIKIVKEEEEFPFFDKINFEVDLMVGSPDEEAEKWVSAGASRVIVHKESFKSINDLDDFVNEFNARFVSEGSLVTTELGLALGTSASVDEVESILDNVDFVQCMGISKIGYQGEPFDEKVFGQIDRLRELRERLIISVDGGVNFETAIALKERGVNRLVVGSTIFDQEDPAPVIEELKNI